MGFVYERTAREILEETIKNEEQRRKETWYLRKYGDPVKWYQRHVLDKLET